MKASWVYPVQSTRTLMTHDCCNVAWCRIHICANLHIAAIHAVRLHLYNLIIYWYHDLRLPYQNFTSWFPLTISEIQHTVTVLEDHLVFFEAHDLTLLLMGESCTWCRIFLHQWYHKALTGCHTNGRIPWLPSSPCRVAPARAPSHHHQDRYQQKLRKPTAEPSAISLGRYHLEDLDCWWLLHMFLRVGVWGVILAFHRFVSVQGTAKKHVKSAKSQDVKPTTRWT